MRILDEDKVTQLYTISSNSGSLFSSKPHMRIYRGVSETPDSMVGTASFHATSRRVDMEFHGKAVDLSTDSMFTRTHVFRSGTEMLKWKRDGILTADLVLMNARKEWIAKFLNASFSISKQGKLEIVNRDLDGEILDQVVISGMAMIEQERRDD